ncbi:MAG: MscL family protein, partial [Chitinophagaceae bacterium]|nr:MscL family protein [Chitinophagaceae bacterium]
PIISLVMGKGGVQDLSFTIGQTVFPIGGFLQAVIDFILVAFVLFMIVRTMNKIMKKKEAVKPPAPTPEDILLLREIRDSLKK